MCLPPTLLGKALSPGSYASAATPALPSPFVLQSPHLQGDRLFTAVPSRGQGSCWPHCCTWMAGTVLLFNRCSINICGTGELTSVVTDSSGPQGPCVQQGGQIYPPTAIKEGRF